MNLWHARREAESALNSSLRSLSIAYEDVFSVIDVCAEHLSTRDSSFARLATVVLIKGRNLTLACYSLCLDALAQEGGAIFRPLIENLELLTYIRTEPSRVEEIFAGRKPAAGEIAKKINGRFKPLRDYLNSNAAHISLEPESIKHLVDPRTLKFQLVQQHNDAVLSENLKLLLAVFTALMVEGVNCVSVTGKAKKELADRADKIASEARKIFEWRGLPTGAV